MDLLGSFVRSALLNSGSTSVLAHNGNHEVKLSLRLVVVCTCLRSVVTEGVRGSRVVLVEAGQVRSTWKVLGRALFFCVSAGLV